MQFGNPRTLDHLRALHSDHTVGFEMQRGTRRGEIIRVIAERTVNAGKILTAEVSVRWEAHPDHGPERSEMSTLWNAVVATGMEYCGEKL